jgi:DNA polymerase-3 subunit alpha
MAGGTRDPILREANAKAAASMPAPRSFIHLRVHSAYSLLEGALPLGKIIGHAVKDRAPAIAVTDTNNLFGALEFAQKAVKDGVQPIVGCQIDVAFEDNAGESQQRNHRRQGPAVYPLVLIAASETGYANLVRLVSRAYLDVPAGGAPHVDQTWLPPLADGIICLTGAERGPIGAALKADHRQVAESRLRFLSSTFGDRLYVELQRYRNHDRSVEASTIDLAYGHDLPLVATNEAFFPAADDYDAHDALMAIAEGSVVAVDDRRRLTHDHHLKSQAEMAALFADLPEALDNTIEIAKRCSYFPQTRAPILPRFTGADASDPAAALAAEADELARQAREGLDARLKDHGPTAGYTEADLPRAAGIRARHHRAHEVSRLLPDRGRLHQVGQVARHSRRPRPRFGRGLARRLCATITDLDPLRFNLLFERFLNPERVSMPDFDIDFCQDRREEVIRYVQQKYGRDAGRPDHHLRNAAGARRAARRRPRAADALRPGRSALQAGAGQSGQSGGRSRKRSNGEPQAAGGAWSPSRSPNACSSRP